MSGLAVAARYLTIVPLGPVPGASPGPALGRAAAWFPVVGLGVGIVLLIADALAARLFPALLGALLVVTTWKILTGGLHLDGLADCLDGLAGRDPGDRLRIMRDSRIGAFGAIGLILFLFVEVAALAELRPDVRARALLAAPAVGRAMPPLLARLFPPARPDGHGALFRTGVTGWRVAAALVAAAVVAVAALGVVGVAGFGAALLAASLGGAFLARRLGGITGDVLGATVELAELTLLVTVVAWPVPPR